ncbi:Acetolactate synthase small subunit [Geodia barretti]|uniref:Acetolactate synthase small subunit n=1 Tax=Geodia barretti TaxID=519541 RepID=A0AA35SAR2_GEOBA|nr:Acetolactate synthase small subunit [Geodia barretti]
MQIVHIFRANIVDVAADSLIVEVIGTRDKYRRPRLPKSFGVVEVMRTGTIAMNRGADSRGRRQSSKVDWGVASSV